MLRLNLYSDFVCNEDYIYIINHKKFKYYKIKKNSEVDFVFEKIEQGYSFEDVVELAYKDGLSVEITKGILNDLLNLNIIEDIDEPISNANKTVKNEFIELDYDSRFGLEIASFAKYENDSMNRYDIFEKLRDAHITIVGAGGVGSFIAVLSAAIGVGEITIIDGDVVEESNLIRQIFYKETQCAKVKKVDALKHFINDLNSKVTVNIIDDYIYSYEHANKHINPCTIVVQTGDKPSGLIDRYVNQTCVEKRIPLIFVHNSTVGPLYVPDISSCYSCFEKYLDLQSKGMYSDVIDIFSNNYKRLYPSNIFGPWLISYILFQEIFMFITSAKENRTLDAFLKVKSNGDTEKIEFVGCSNCMCKS